MGPLKRADLKLLTELERDEGAEDFSSGTWLSAAVSTSLERLYRQAEAQGVPTYQSRVEAAQHSMPEGHAKTMQVLPVVEHAPCPITRPDQQSLSL